MREIQDEISPNIEEMINLNTCTLLCVLLEYILQYTMLAHTYCIAGFNMDTKQLQNKI